LNRVRVGTATLSHTIQNFVSLTTRVAMQSQELRGTAIAVV